MKFFRLSLITLILLVLPISAYGEPIVVNHHSAMAFDDIPAQWIEAAKNLTMHYAHTSHGNRLVQGPPWLEGIDSTYSFARRASTSPGLPPIENPPAFRMYDGTVVSTYATPDLYWEGSTAMNYTRQVLNAGVYDMSGWSWCGQATYYSDTAIQLYLDNMAILEGEYPGIRFMYMTGHVNDASDDQNRIESLARHNNMIRDWVINHPEHPSSTDRILFDYNDLEKYDPDGSLHANSVNDDCTWCEQYCADNPSYCQSLPSECSHTGYHTGHTLICKQMAKAFWWMMARVAGWDGGVSSDTTPPENINDLSVTSCDTDSCDLSWTSPGDDANTGTASAYDIRYSTSTINSGNFLSANTVSGEPNPLVAGSSQSMTVIGLNDGITYYFAMRTRDEASNWSDISNVVSDSTDPIPDTTPPASIGNLTVVSCSDTTCSLRWNSPGDDGNTGTAAAYDIRYSTSQITASNFDSALSVSNEPLPQSAGTQQNMTVTDLIASTTYYFAIKTRDEVPNWSDISNVVSETTDDLPDTLAPDPIVDLSVLSCGVSSCQLGWSATGDDGSSGTAYRYDLRYSTSAITEGNFDSASLVIGEPVPLSSGSYQSMNVTGLANSTTFYFAMKVRDEAENWSDLSNVVNDTTEIPSDTDSPERITDLSITTCDTIWCDLTWTAPGDDGNSGTAQSYDIRYSDSIITESNFLNATVVSGGSILPQHAGSTETFRVTDLDPSTTYYFAIRASDESSNVSDVSNSPYGITLDVYKDDTDDDIDPNINPQTDGDRDPYETLFKVAGGCGMTDIRNASNRNNSMLFLTFLILLSIVAFIRKREV